MTPADPFAGLGAIDVPAAAQAPEAPAPARPADPFAGLGAVDISTPAASAAPVAAAPAVRPDPFAGLGAVDAATSPPAEEYKPNEAAASSGLATPGSPFLHSEDVSRIESSSGADPEYIRHAAPWFGLVSPGEDNHAASFTDLMKSTAGQYVPELGLDLYKKLAEDDPAKRRALDALQAEAHSRRSYVRAAAGQLAPLAAGTSVGGAVGETLDVVGEAADYAPKAIAAARRVTQTFLGMGAMGAQGALEASEDHETAGAVIGSLLYLGFPVAAHLLGKGVGAVVGAAGEAATSAFEEFIAPKAAQGAAAEAFSTAEPQEAALSQVIRGFNPAAKPDLNYFSRAVPRELQELMAELAHEAPSEGEAARGVVTDAIEETAEDEAAPAADSVSRAAYNVYTQTRVALGKIIGVQSDSDWRAAFTRAAADSSSPDGYVADRVAALRLGSYLKQAISDLPESQQLGEVGWVRRQFLRFADAQFVYDAIDNRFGTELSPLLARGSRLYGGYTWASTQTARGLRDAVRGLSSAESRTLDGIPFREEADAALRAGEFPDTKFTEKQVAALRGFRDFYAAERERVNQLPQLFPGFDLTPVRVPELVAGSEKSYVPNYAVELAEGIARTRQKMRDYGLPVDQLFADVESGTASPAAQELHDGLQYFFGAPIESVEDARAAAAIVDGAPTRSAAGVRSSAASLFQREGSIPGYLLERDHLRLAQGWSTSMYRHVFMRGFISDMMLGADAISDVSPVFSKYVRQHASDLLGPRSYGLAASISGALDRLRIAGADAASKTTNPLMRAVYSTAANADDIMRAATANMYSFYLGLNPASAARVASQTVTNTLPQMSPAHMLDASARVGRAYAETAAKLFARDASNAFVELRELGIMPSAQMFEATQQARSAMATTFVGRAAKTGLDAANAVSMKLYQAADVIGRYSTLVLARDVVADAAAGDMAALAHLERIPAGYLSAIRRDLRTGNTTDAATKYADYLIGTTQGNYNRVTMSEWGRSAGYLFSMFSKWPSMAAGELGGVVDAASIGRRLNGDVGRVLWKYLAPAVITSQVQPWWKSEYADAPWAARIIIGRDVRKWFPSEGAAGLLAGEFTAKPIFLEAAQSAATGIVEGHPEVALGAAGGLAVSALPFSSYLRFATNVLPGWMGEDPLIPLTPREIQKAARGD